MYWASSFSASGAGLSRPRFSMARSTMPVRSGHLSSARSYSSTGTRAFTQCAAISAPITPAPSTATLPIESCFIVFLRPVARLRALSEQLGLELHQVLRPRACGTDMVSGLRQQALEVEPGRRQLGAVERIGSSGAAPSPRRAAHPAPEVREYPVPGPGHGASGSNCG